MVSLLLSAYLSKTLRPIFPTLGATRCLCCSCASSSLPGQCRTTDHSPLSHYMSISHSGSWDSTYTPTEGPRNIQLPVLRLLIGYISIHASTPKKNCRRTKDPVGDRNRKNILHWRKAVCNMGKEFFMDFPMEHHGTNVVNHLRDVWLASSLLLPPRLPYSHDPDGKTDGIIGWKCPMVTLRINLFAKDQDCGQACYTFTRHGFNGNGHTLNLLPVGRVDLFLTATYV